MQLKAGTHNMHMHICICISIDAYADVHTATASLPPLHCQPATALPACHCTASQPMSAMCPALTHLDQHQTPLDARARTRHRQLLLPQS